MRTAEGTIATLRQGAEQRSTNASEKRRAKRIAEGKPTRKRVDHPIHLSKEETTKQIESDQEDDDASSVEDGLEDLEGVFAAYTAVDHSQVMTINATINGHVNNVIADTGASRALINRKDADRIGLTIDPSSTPRQFAGLGSVEGVPTQSTEVTIGGRTRKVTFFVIENSTIPILIGHNDLAKFDALIDPLNSCLLDRVTHESIAIGIEQGNPSIAKQPELDPITQKRLGATDKELFRDGKDTILAKTQHLTPERQQKVWELFAKFKDVWLRPRPGAAKNHKAVYRYNGPPIKQRQRYLAPELREEFIKQTKAMIESGVLEPSKSSFASQPVFASKKDGGWRLCLDYRAVNKNIKPDRYPIPRLWDCILTAAHHNYYCALDVNWGFWSLPLSKESREVTAIMTPNGLYQFTVAPFGIRNSPPEFQRMMDTVFADLPRLQKYIDDIIIYALTFDELFLQLRDVLQRMKDEGLFLKLSKVELFLPEITMLGFNVGIDGIRPHPKKIQGIKDAQLPRDKKQVKAFLGSMSFLRKFIPNLATILAPLTHLTRKGIPFVLTDKHVTAFETAKGLLSEHILLNAPKGNGAFVLVTDASEVGVGAAFLQWQDDKLVVLEFASKTLTPAETKWPAYEREAYAIRWGVERFEDYIKAGFTVVISDHKPLVSMSTATNSKVLRWSLYLQQFDLDIRHINGEKNQIADWLSRSCAAEDPFDDDPALDLPTFFLSDKSNPENELPSTRIFPRVPSVEEFRRATIDAPGVEVKETYLSPDGIRFHIRTNRIYVPPSLREPLLYLFHVTPLGLHLGINRTCRRLSSFVWWPKLNQSVSAYIGACLVCVRKLTPTRLATLSGVLSRPLPLQLISLDFVGPRPWPNNISYYYLVIIDHASRFIVTVSTSSPPTSEWLINMFRRLWVAIFATPTAILHDRGSQFVSEKFKDYVVNTLNCISFPTSSYYPQGNAINEASHKSLDAMLIMCSNLSPLPSFAESLFISTLIHNATPHVATGFSPFFFLHGFEPVLPGFQHLQREATTTTHLQNLNALHLRRLCQASILSNSDLRVTKPKSKFQIGDWVVFQRALPKFKPKVDSQILYSSQWSLPAKIISIQHLQATVETWRARTKIDIPITKLRKLQGSVPLSLRDVNTQHLQLTSPAEHPAPTLQQDLPAQQPIQQYLEEVRPPAIVTTCDTRSRKRRNLSVHFDTDPSTEHSPETKGAVGQE